MTAFETGQQIGNIIAPAIMILIGIFIGYRYIRNKKDKDKLKGVEKENES